MKDKIKNILVWIIIIVASVIFGMILNYLVSITIFEVRYIGKMQQLNWQNKTIEMLSKTDCKKFSLGYEEGWKCLEFNQ
jgi:uncharacterized protein YneF (UPF0154 family)